ncbi:MAG: hypothetical protein Q8L08_03585 [Candidatus Nanopelagicaceae bacterium]|nr:hypothetical protein [Candidatus Nanopelagicaceae bacterium]
MRNSSGGQLMVAEHSHEEVWNVVPGLSPELNQLAHDLLPTMKRAKRLVIRIGAAGLQGDSPNGVVALAYELAAICSESAEQIAHRYEGAAKDGPIGQIVRDLKFLAESANHIATFGMDGESAKALRLGYRAFRNSCALLWFYEFAPEGRPRFLRGAT